MEATSRGPRALQQVAAVRVSAKSQGGKSFEFCVVTKLCKNPQNPLRKGPVIHFAKMKLTIHLWAFLHLLKLSDFSLARLSSVTDQVDSALQPKNRASESFLMNELANGYFCDPLETSCTFNGAPPL